MRIARILLFIFLLLVAALGITRFLFLDQLTAMALNKAGIRNADIHFSTLNPRKTQIDTLQATFRLPSGELLPVTLTDVSLHYSLQQLLTTGKCSRISVGTLKIRRPPPETKSAVPLSLPEHISLLRNDLRARLPLQELRIHRLLLTGDVPNQIKEKDIQLHALVDRTGITVNIRLQLDKNTLITVNMNSVDARQATAILTGVQGGEEIIKTTVTLTPDALTAAVDLQLLPMQDLLLQTTAIRKQIRIDGGLTAHLTLPLPLQEHDNINADLSLADSAGHQLHLKADGNPNTGKLTLLFNGQEHKQQFIRTEFTLAGQRVKGSYQFQGASLADFLQPYLLQPLPEISGRFNGILDIPLPGSTNTSFQFTGEATSPVLGALSSSSTQLRLSGELTGRTVKLDNNAQFRAEKLNLGTARIKAMSLDLAGSFSKFKDKFSLQFVNEQQLSIQGLTAGKLALDSLQAVPQSPLQISVSPGSWAAAANSFQIQSIQAAYGKNNISSGPVICNLTRLEKSGTGIRFDAAVTTPTLVLDSNTLKLPLKNLSSTVQLNQNQVTGKIQFAPQSIPGRVKAAFSHDLSTAAGSLTLRTDRRLDVDEEGISLAQLLTPWQYPFDLDRGKISFKVEGSWAPDQRIKLAAFTAVTGGAGYFKQFLFNDLNIRQDLAVLPSLFSKAEGSFVLQQLIGAVDVHDIRAGLNFIPSTKGSMPQVKINDFSASLFAGSINSPAILYDLNQPDTTFTVRLNNMDLTTMIQMIRMDNLQVTGRVSGDIPITIMGKTVTVNNGTLYSEPPGGEIRYTPANMNQIGVTGYALEAVEDFRYNSLKTTVEYLPSGQLNLGIGLQGISPGLSTTRPVHLNINAEQNLPSLLQSLRFSKGLTDELDKRVKQHYK